MLEVMMGRFFSSLTKTGILKKVIAGYIMIILVPSILLGTFIYEQFFNNMMNEHISQKQQILNEYYSSLENDLAKIQGIYSLFQYNTNVTDYLDGNYISDMDSVYTFQKYIKPVYSYVYSSMNFIKDMKIYKNNDNVLSIPSIIVNIDMLANSKDVHDKLISGTGVWSCIQAKKGDLPDLKYYQKIYNNDFYKGLGILEIQPNSAILENYLNNIKSLSKGHDGVYLIDMNNNVLFETGESKISVTKSVLDKLPQNVNSRGYVNTKLQDEKIIGNVIYINSLNIKTIVLEYEGFEPKYLTIKKSIIFLYVIILFCVLSTIYYFITANITTRVLRLAKHMRNVNERNISLYTGKRGKDEIGFLIDSYNSMIRRINDLVNTVHRVELLRKEAAYAALQAQIRPHFLFGTLESIRMLAESNKDFDVSNIIFTFGRLMRYSISSSNNEVSLTDEIENVKNYLKIQKIRMGERLQYEINDETDMHQFLCPRFILQPLVENSVVHGVSQRRGQGFISVAVTNDEEYIIITIFDNGHGISHEKQLVLQSVLDNKIDIKDFQTENSGFGIYNVSERIKAYYGKDSRLVLSSQLTKGTECTLYLYRHKGDFTK